MEKLNTPKKNSEKKQQKVKQNLKNSDKDKTLK